MPDDDDSDCPEHVFVLTAVTLDGNGATCEEQCSRCGTWATVGGNGRHDW